ncbi:MAG: sugar phosphate isomerase/epimerase, partial [bacterium]|nr:sugar phosphate isomerase/epimerase [bacterium]
MRTGISTLVDLEIPLPRLLELIASTGFDCVGLSHNVEHSGYHTAAGRKDIRRLLDTYGLGLDYIHPPIQSYYDLTSQDEQVRRISVEVAKLSISACAELGGRSVTIHLCNTKNFPENELEDRTAQGLRSLEELLPFAAASNVLFCAENLPNHFSGNNVTLAILRKYDGEGLYVTLDPNHAWINHEDPMALVRELAPRARATHFCDTFGRNDSHLLPFTGKVDMPAVARALATSGFSTKRGDVVNLECSVMMQRRRVHSGKLHEGDPGWRTTDAGANKAIKSERMYG